MKLVQKVLSHGLLIAFFVAVFFIYMNRVELFPQWFAKSAPVTAEQSQVQAESPATVAGQVSPPDTVASEPDAVILEQDAVVMESVAEPPAAAPGDNQAQVSAELVQPAVEPQVHASDGSEPVFRPLPETEPVEVAESVSGNEAGEPQVQASDDPEPVFRPMPETEPVEVAESVSGNEAGSQQADIVSAPLEEAVAATEEETVVSTEQLVTEQGAVAGQDSAAADDFQGRLEQARAYFWQRDMRAALQTYQSLTESYPERAEVWGELGNLYFNIRRTSDAMNAYAHAAELLIEQGDAEGARELLNVMYRLDARRASQFEMRLRQAGAGVAADGR